MSASKHPIPKICLRCQKVFEARKASTIYCSNPCASKAYKERMRAKKSKIEQHDFSLQLQKPILQLQSRDIFSLAQLSDLIGVSRWTIMRLHKAKKLKMFNVGRRKFILKTDLETFLKSK